MQIMEYFANILHQQQPAKLSRCKAVNLVVVGSTVDCFKYVADWLPQLSWGKASRLRLAAHSSGLSAAGISIRIDKISAATRNQNP
jgi:cell division inhibitor SulA